MREDKTKAKKRPLWVQWLRWIFLSVLLCILFVVLVWAGLQSRWAKDRLAGWVASATAGTDGYQVNLQGLDGLLPFSILLDRMTLSDGKGVWLEGRRVDISLNPARLLTGMLDVELFRMEGLSISRLPESPTPPSGEEPEKEIHPLSLPHVVVREIQIDRIDLEKKVADAPMAYSLRSTAQTSGRNMQVHGRLQDLDHPTDALRLAAAYDLGTREIATELTYRESKGGLAAGIMNLPEARGITLDLKAGGPLSAIQGHLDLEIGGYGRANLVVELGLNRPVTVAVDGQIRTDPRIVRKDVTAAMGGLNGDIHFRATVSSERKIRIKAFTARTPSSAISVKGTADLVEGLMDMQAVVSPLDISPFLRGSDLEHQSLGPVRLTAKGAFTRPEVMVTTTLGRFGVQGANLNEITLKAHAAFGKDYTGIKNGRASVTVQNPHLPQVPALKGPLRMDMAAASPDFRKWDIEDLHVTAPEMELRAQGARIDTTNGDFSAHLFARLHRLSGLIPPGARDLDGRLVMRGRTEGNTATGRIQADLSMALTRLSGLPPVAAQAVGPELTVNTRATIQDHILRLERTHMTGGTADLKVDGYLNIGKRTFDVQYHLLLKDLAKMAGAARMPLSGRLSSQGRITGGFEDFAADIALSSEKLRVNGLDLEAIHMHLKTEGLPRKPSGSLRAGAAALDQPLHLDAPFSWSGDTLTLSGARATLPGIRLSADLEATPSTEHVSGTARGEVASLVLLKALSGLEADGRGAFRVKAGGPAQPEGMTLDAGFKDLRFKGHPVSTLTIKGHVDHVKTLRGQVRLAALDGVFKDTRLKRLTLDVGGALDKAVVKLEAEGFHAAKHDGERAGVPVSLAAGLRVQHDAMWRFHLDLFKAVYGELDVALAQPATITINGREIALDDLKIHTAKGNLQARAQLGAETVEASAQLTDLPLDLFEPFIGRDLSGTVSAGCDISGAPTDPVVKVQVQIKDQLIPRGHNRPPLRLEARLDASRRGERFDIDLELSGLSKVPFSAVGSIPARLCLEPFVFDLNRTAQLEGKLTGSLDLAVLQGIAGLDNQTIEGLLEVDMGVQGSLEKWLLNGGIAISRGRYENVELGLILADINGRMDADGRKLRLSRLTAVDGGAGAIALAGGITTQTPFPMDADLTFKQATLLRKEVLTSTASGKLALKGDLKRLDLTGEMILDPTELTIPGKLPPDVVIIPVTEINLPPGMPSGETPPSSGPRFLFMDLAIQIPARFFVRGRGLDVEFKGRLNIQGPAHNPAVRGTLSVVRGTFHFLSRTFHVASGQIAFDGATPPVPYLNITTRVSAGQIDAQVSVTGPADAFRVTLTSQPPLPQDEIMAQILFGQSVAKLNAFQAYQLAASVSQLSGGGIPDIAGETRKLLGIDRLSIDGGGDDKAANNGPTLSAGKYVTDRVYVGVEQDITEAKQDVVVEVEITPSFSVESKAGTKSGAGIGFNWKYDY